MAEFEKVLFFILFCMMNSVDINQARVWNNNGLTDYNIKSNAINPNHLQANRLSVSHKPKGKRMKTQLNRLNESLQLLKRDFQNLQREQLKLKQLLKSQSHNTAEQLSMDKLKGPLSTATIAFMATQNSSLMFRQEVVITYNDIITNLGGAFDGESGKFQCTWYGVYNFQWQGLGFSNNKETKVKMYHNERAVATAFEQVGDRGSVALSAVLVLYPGDTVDVRLAGGFGIYSNADIYTTFSGFLLALL